MFNKRRSFFAKSSAKAVKKKLIEYKTSGYRLTQCPEEIKPLIFCITQNLRSYYSYYIVKILYTLENYDIKI